MTSFTRRVLGSRSVTLDVHILLWLWFGMANLGDHRSWTQQDQVLHYAYRFHWTGNNTSRTLFFCNSHPTDIASTYRITFAGHVTHCWWQNSPVQQLLIVYLFWSQSGKACVSFLIASPWRRPEPWLTRPVCLQQLIEASGPWETGVLMNVPLTLAPLHPSGSASRGRSSRQRRVAVCCGSCVKVSVCG